MDPITISWIVAIITGSVIAKFLGLVMKGRDPGMVAGPIIGIIGAVAAWQGAVFLNLVAPADAVLAGVCAALGGAVAYLIAALLK
ncbi:MAG: hypothetical protein MRY64_00240 [Hyphomonadaceae bacterium]|nr:hypothetical protein [Hyphomonadaceae bacterium]